MFGTQFVETDPCGTMKDIGKGNKPIDVNFHDALNKSYFRNTEGIPPEYSRYFKQHHTSITNDLNNLMNFNPTSAGQTYYEHNDADKMLHYPESRPRFESVNYRDTSIPNKINDMKVDGRIYEKPIEHSQGLKVTNVRADSSGMVQNIGKYNSIKRRY
jgi:hypothetical protein